jgi:hypothetical protein
MIPGAFQKDASILLNLVPCFLSNLPPSRFGKGLGEGRVGTLYFWNKNLGSGSACL